MHCKAFDCIAEESTHKGLLQKPMGTRDTTREKDLMSMNKMFCIIVSARSDSFSDLCRHRHMCFVSGLR